MMLCNLASHHTKSQEILVLSLAALLDTHQEGLRLLNLEAFLEPATFSHYESRYSFLFILLLIVTPGQLCE